jgi:DNA-binding CsgD family transcriptional regulator
LGYTEIHELIKLTAMIHEAVLMRTAERVTAYLEKYAVKIGAERREDVLHLYDTMHEVFPEWVIMTCPMMHRDIHYASKNCLYVFGYEQDYLVRNSSMEKYFNHVHDADQEDLFNCFAQLHDFLENISPEDHHEYRTVFYYRFRKGDGKYIHLHDEKATLNLKGSGNLYYGLFRDVTADRPFTGVKLEIFRKEETLKRVFEFKPSEESRSLSKREKELVVLMRQGLSTKEIAWHLNISHHTVRNIKSKLFEKYNVNNSIELLNMTA